jgi:hypothetical protein
MSKKVAEKLVIKVEYLTEEGKVLKEIPIHELNVKEINSIWDIGITDKDAQEITGKIEEKLSEAQEERTKTNLKSHCPRCGSKRNKKKAKKS